MNKSQIQYSANCKNCQTDNKEIIPIKYKYGYSPAILFEMVKDAWKCTKCQCQFKESDISVSEIHESNWDMSIEHILVR